MNCILRNHVHFNPHTTHQIKTLKVLLCWSMTIFFAHNKGYKEIDRSHKWSERFFSQVLFFSSFFMSSGNIIIRHPHKPLLINNHIGHPSSQRNHSNKLLISAIIHQNIWPIHKTTMQKIRAHTGIIRNKTNQLVNDGRTYYPHAQANTWNGSPA